MLFYEIHEGAYAGTKGISYRINSANYSARLDLDDPEASIYYHMMLNQLGLDGDMCSVSLAWAFECFEKGLLSKEDADGLELRWGDEKAILEMQRRLAYREGIGDILADGVKESARKLGKDSDTFAIYSKGQDSIDPYRAGRGWEFGISISPVAGRHLRGAVSVPAVTGPRDLQWAPTEWKNVPDVVFWQTQTKELVDMTGLCIFIGTWSGAHALEVSDYTELISSAMGIEISENELMMIGRRGINLEKAFNTIHTAFDRKDDYPPRRYIEEPIKSGPCAGARCEREKWGHLLDRFYIMNGWDRETGWQTQRCLTELDMEDVAQRLETVGRLK